MGDAADDIDRIIEREVEAEAMEQYEAARALADERYERERQRVADLADEAARRLTDDLGDVLPPGARVEFDVGDLLHDDRPEV